MRRRRVVALAASPTMLRVWLSSGSITRSWISPSSDSLLSI